MAVVRATEAVAEAISVVAADRTQALVAAKTALTAAGLLHTIPAATASRPGARSDLAVGAALPNPTHSPEQEPTTQAQASSPITVAFASAILALKRLRALRRA